MSDYPDLPKVGDIVTWEDTYTGHGTFDGKVVSLDAKGVFVSRLRYGVGNGTRYALVPYERKAAFTAGKFHSAGGYAHALKETRAKLAGTTATMIRFMDLCAKWRPLVEALETYPNQFVEIGFDAGLHFPLECIDKRGEHYTRTVRYEDVCKPLVSQSDPFAQLDFAEVGVQVSRERRQMTPAESETQHKMVEEFTKGIDTIMIEAINFRSEVKP